MALTFWWPQSGRQIRIQGIAKGISDSLADELFNQRTRESQAVSVVSRTGSWLDNRDALEHSVRELILQEAAI